jgi:hypothetical protein
MKKQDYVPRSFSLTAWRRDQSVQPTFHYAASPSTTINLIKKTQRNQRTKKQTRNMRKHEESKGTKEPV